MRIAAMSRRLASVTALVALAAIQAQAFPLTTGQAKCANKFIKGSAKVLGAYGKSASSCVKRITMGKEAAADPGQCVLADPRGKLAKARAKVDGGIAALCSIPYPMDCPFPCEATDGGGLTASIDDDAELIACLQCFNPATSWSAPQATSLKGLHGAVLDGVSIASRATDPGLAQCQERLVKGYDKVFSRAAGSLAKCAKIQFKNPGLAAPPANCVPSATAGPKTTKKLAKLADLVAACGATTPFDAGACAGLGGHPSLTDCLNAVVRCRLCRWGDTMVGSQQDCDLFDDALANMSCTPPTGATTTTTITTTTTAGGPTTTVTTTTGAGPTTTTTTLLPTTTCSNLIATWGVFGTSNGQFNRPRGVGVASDNKVYVVDSKNDRVQFFSPLGSFLGRWGSIGQGNGEFDRPRGMAINSADNVYIADRTNNRIQKFTSSGVFLATWGVLGTGNGQFFLPRDVAIAPNGNVYVADGGNNRIQVFTADGVFLSGWGSFGAGNGQFNVPRNLTIDASGNVYVSDLHNHRIQKFSSSGSFISAWGSFGTGNGQFNEPHGLEIEPGSTLLVADSKNHRIQRFTLQGAFIEAWGSLGAGFGQFNMPRGIADNGSGIIYITDADNHRVQAFVCN